MKRYFIVSYTYSTGRSFGFGSANYSSDRFINRDTFTKQTLKRNTEFKSVTITNVLELSKEDFDNWTKEIGDE